jgi:prevent-host-death family protein
MREREAPVTQTIKASDARAQWSQLVNQVFGRQKRVLVEKSGIPVAALVSADDLERLERLEAQEAEDVRILQASRAALRDAPDEEVEREVDRAFQEARGRHRSQAATKGHAPVS